MAAEVAMAEAAAGAKQQSSCKLNCAREEARAAEAGARVRTSCRRGWRRRRRRRGGTSRRRVASTSVTAKQSARRPGR